MFVFCVLFQQYLPARSLCLEHFGVVNDEKMRPRICQFVVLLALSYLSCSHGLTNPSRKNWWAKRVASDDFYTCGRPTERQIKYASETGFKTLISLHTYDSDMGNVTAPGGIYLPSTARTRYIAEQIAGMDFRVVLPSGVRNWMSLDVISRIHAIIRQSTKPLLFYCASSYGATFLTLAHFLNVSTHNDNLAGETKLTDSELFSVGAQLGFDFINNTTLRRLVSEIVGRNKVSEPLAPEVIIKSWQIKYWQMKPVYKHIFVAGQIQSNELEAIRSAGIKTIINNRKGTTIPPKDEKSQEEVGLLNVKDMTGTYSGTGRQRTEQLEANRIDPYKPTIYISDTSTLNYEMNNTLEFGDDIGYNETMERMAIENMLPGVEYIHLPISKTIYTYLHTRLSKVKFFLIF